MAEFASTVSAPSPPGSSFHTSVTPSIPAGSAAETCSCPATSEDSSSPSDEIRRVIVSKTSTYMSVMVGGALFKKKITKKDAFLSVFELFTPKKKVFFERKKMCFLSGKKCVF
jgi:hypothetical protein